MLGNLQMDRKDQRLVVHLDIANYSTTNKVDYRSWSFEPSGTRLSDELGNTYPVIDYGTSNHAIAPRRNADGGWDTIKQMDKVAIHPRMVLHDFMVFEKPVKPARQLSISLPARNCGLSGTFDLVFPTSSIE
jgi:hypothetical protein